MVINFADIDPRERPTLILRNLAGDPLATLGYAFNIRVKLCYNEVSELSFDLPAFADGEKTPAYDSVIGMRLAELKGFGLFILSDPSETDTGKKKVKSCKAYSLEYEFTYKKISMPKGTYEFYNAVGYEDSIVGRLQELMPKWAFEVDDTLIGKYRTFEVNGENLYNFMKSTLQTSYGCIFDFDSYSRTVKVRDVNRQTPARSVFLSTQNLIKELTVDEDTEGIVTCLDVSGAEGVNIRDVNPIGSNKIYNLDYFLEEENFSPGLIRKWNDWKEECAAGQQRFYEMSLGLELLKSRLTTENANLADLKAQYASFEALQSAAREALAREKDSAALKDALEEANKNVLEQQAKVEAQSKVIEELESEIEAANTQLREFIQPLKPAAYFTKEEWEQFDFYIKEDSVSDSSFAMSTVVSYAGKDFRGSWGGPYWVSEGTVTKIPLDNGNTIYTIEGGVLSVPDAMPVELYNRFPAKIIRATLERTADNRVIFSALLNLPVVGAAQTEETEGESEERKFRTAYLSMTGTYVEPTQPGGDRFEDDTQFPEPPKPEEDPEEPLNAYAAGSWVKFPAQNAFVYVTESATEYEQRSVAWTLYDYGVETLRKLAFPSYTFSVSSANFLALEEFEAFKDQLKLGERIFLQLDEAETLQPFVIGLELDFEDPSSFTIEFSDKYCASDAAFRLVDLLEQSVSMGKSVDFSKYTYRAFVDSGAQTEVQNFMEAALDVSKNAVLSSKSQAISWDESGLKLRKWLDDKDHSKGYENDQIAVINNNIVFTDDGFATAKMAIGRFQDENRGSCFGVVAPNIVGTLLAGKNLMIQGKAEDGKTVVFQVDETGAKLHNAEFDIISHTSQNKDMQIALNPDIGIAIGEYPVYQNGALNKSNATFYVDIESGDAFFRGVVQAKDYLDMNGKSMLVDKDNDYRIDADYLSLYGLEVKNKATQSTVFSINDNGNITMTGNIKMTGGSISWSNVNSDPVATRAGGMIDALASGTFDPKAWGFDTTFIDGTNIYSPNISFGTKSDTYGRLHGGDGTVTKVIYLESDTGGIKLVAGAGGISFQSAAGSSIWFDGDVRFQSGHMVLVDGTNMHFRGGGSLYIQSGELLVKGYDILQKLLTLEARVSELAST